MKNVEVLLRENVDSLGRCGDVVRVAPGYARNYLLPRRIAVQATADNIRSMQRRRERLDAEEAAKLADAQSRADAIGKLVLTTRGKADEGGHLYGSVNAAAIVELLGQRGHTVSEKDVRLEAPIKTVGEHVVPVHVHGDLVAEIRVTVEAESEA